LQRHTRTRVPLPAAVGTLQTIDLSVFRRQGDSHIAQRLLEKLVGVGEFQQLAPLRLELSPGIQRKRDR
jgi:hypothetical protein